MTNIIVEAIWDGCLFVFGWLALCFLQLKATYKLSIASLWLLCLFICHRWSDMPDICMCVNQSCPFREKCYRYMAIPDFLQTYASFSPKEESCNRFLPIGDKIAKRAKHKDSV